MSELQRQILGCLSDGEFHSGEELGERLGVSRAAVWKHVQVLEGRGFKIASERGRGYRMSEPLELLDAGRIRSALVCAQKEQLLSRLVCGDVLESTNTYLLDLAASEDVSSGAVCFAEEQTAGRGRRGRPWLAGYGQNILMSALWRFDQGVTALEGLSLATGVAIVRALSALGVEGAQLKWPNDVLWKGQKLAGVLLEIGGDASGDCHVVVGIGLNLQLSSACVNQIDQPATDISTMGYCVSRNELAAELVSQLLSVLSGYHRSGFESYRDEWEANAVYLGEEIVIETMASSVSGRMLGVSENGSLLVEVEGRKQAFLGGEVSLRVQA